MADDEKQKEAQPTQSTHNENDNTELKKEETNDNKDNLKEKTNSTKDNKEIELNPEARNELNNVVNSNNAINNSNNSNVIPIENPNLDNSELPNERYSKLDEDEAMSINKGSNYIQNIKMSNSSAGLTLGEKEKDGAPLTDSTTVARFSPVWKQSLAASASILLTFTAGLTSGYSGILLPQLENDGSFIHLDDSTASWIAAMAVLPMAPGCLISGWMMEKFGRKTSNYMICVPFLLGWILIACARDLSLILLGRFFTGLCVGLLGPLSPVYIAETSEPRYRGFFLAGVSLAIAVGILVAHAIGTFVTWQWTAAICCAFPILSAIMLTLVPESPTWLIAKGQAEDGIKSFYWLRGYGEDAKIELKGLIDKQKATDSEPPMTCQEKLNSLKTPILMKPLFIMIIFFITCQLSGVNAVAFYSISIVEKAVGKGSIDHYLAMLIIDGLRVVMSVVACVVCKQYGRRPLCFISGIWTALSMVGLSLYLYWTGGKQTDMAWLPLSCLLIYITAISIGLVPLPWIMCGEVFPTKMRGLGSGISSATTFVAFFIVVKTAPAMMNNLGDDVTFLIYGITALIGTIVMYFILPETKGRSLQEIEDRFKGGKLFRV